MTAPVPVEGSKAHLAFAYQSKQFNVGSPAGVGPCDRSIFDSLASPEESGVAAIEASDPLTEDAEWRLAHDGKSKIESGHGGA